MKYILTSGVLFIGYWADGFYMLIRGLSIPIFNNYLNVKKVNEKLILKALNFLSYFCIVSGIPFLLNLVQPISRGYVLEDYGAENNGFVGIFQNPHGAAIIISQALLILLFNIVQAKKINHFKIIIFLLGCFILYKTYVRTGYMMFFVGIFFLIKIEYGIKKLYKIAPLVILLAFGAYSFYQSDTALQGRIKQENIYSKDDSFSIDKLSSGRLTLSYVNLKNWSERDPFSIIFGLGFQYSTDLMLEDINMRKASHNGFVDALVHNGLIGFMLYILFLGSIFRKIKKSKNSIYYSLGISSFIAFLLFILFQGGNVFLLEILLLMIIYLLQLTKGQKN
ncbi:MAG: O-antigen ligase family protein [Lishizhenia sp.]